MRQVVHYFTFKDKTVFIPLKFVYPECFVHIKDSPQLFPLKCFMEDACPPGANCGEILVRRVHYLFENVMPLAEVLIAYFKYHDRPASIRGAIFRKSLDIPTVGILNPSAFKKFQRQSLVHSWDPTDEYLFMGGSKGLIQITEKIV